MTGRVYVYVCVGVYACELDGWFSAASKRAAVMFKKPSPTGGGDAEKSRDSYYPAVFNWDLIDPSIIHRDCQCAVYVVCSTSVFRFRSLISLLRNTIYAFCFLLCFIYFYFSYVSRVSPNRHVASFHRDDM